MTSDAELAQAAREGDRQAAGTLIGRHLPYLNAVARRIAGTRIDHEDLLSGTLTRLLELWSRGEGPDDQFVPYLATAMRNRVIDLSRSPRSQEISVADPPEPTDAETPSQFRDAELHAEFDLVRRAVARLPPDMARALNEVIVNGRPPREVAAELGRSPGAVSTLVTRAKTALRRELLVMLLEEGREGCAVNAELLPAQVLQSPDEHDASAPGIAHILGCEECRANWRRYVALVGALGVLPLLVVGGALGGAAPPASATPGQQGGSGSSGPVGSTAGSEGSVAATAPAAAGSGLPAAGALWNLIAGRAGMIVAIVSTAAGVVLICAVVLSMVGAIPAIGTPQRVTVSTADAPTAQLATTVTPRADGEADLGVRFRVDANRWAITRFDVTLPPEVRIVVAPDGWRCSTTAGGGSCTPSSPTAGSATFTLAATDGPASGTYLVRVEATAGSVTVSGTSTGQLSAAR